MPRETALLGWKTFILVFCLALVLGSMYRFTDLGKKPMHTDEAILALKTQEFWRTNSFEYDPKDYHGPFLHEAARGIGRLRSLGPEDMNDRRLRCVVAVFGMAIVLLPLLFVDAIGRTGVAMAALLLAVSPMMTYYSRYYIMEVPFVFLTGLLLASVWRWTQSQNNAWLVLGGVCLGFMHATKETFVINVAAMFAGAVAVWITGNTFEPKSTRLEINPRRRRRVSWKSVLWLAVPAVVVSVWEFSNGFREWNGVRDSVLTYLNYLERSGGSGHEKSWTYYITLLFWRKDGFVWTEAFIGSMAIVGIISLSFHQKLPRQMQAVQIFLAVYTVVLLAFYSLIPYKTPWSVLAVNFSFALLAGMGVRWLFVLLKPWGLRIVLLLMLTAGVYHLCQQTSLATDYKFPGQVRYSADARNPYVYSHTSPNLLKMADLVLELIKLTPEGNGTPIQVVQAEYGWPLGWYWRDLRRVAYQASFPDKLTAPIVVVDMAEEEQARELLDRSSEANPPSPYISSIYGLRPGMNIVLLVRGDLWQLYENAKQSRRDAGADQVTQ